MTGARRLASAASVLASLLLIASTAHAADGNLPGGTSISAEIATPAAGALIASPPGDVALTGGASIGQGVPIANTTLVYVVDTSGSTGPFGLAGCGGDQNGDGTADTILDCEIAAGIALNQDAVAAGTVGEVGAVFFNSNATIRDVDPGAGTAGLTGPGTDSDASGDPDIEEVLRSAVDGGPSALTNFEAAVQQACSLVQQSTNPNNIVVFLSDGVATTGSNAVDDLPCAPTAATFRTFAVGSGSDCDTDNGGRGSLQQIADATGGDCTEVENVADLPDVIPGVIDSELTELQLSVDGGAPVDISSSATPALPQTGPANVTFATTVPGLAPGEHTLCVTATGTDGGGEGSVQDCVDLVVADIVLTPATATNELGDPAQATHTVTALVEAGADGGVAGVDVSFAITAGPNDAVADVTATTDAGGEAGFTYTAVQGPAGLGTDAIEACFTDDQGTAACDTATKEWVDTTAPVAACSPTSNPAGKTVPSAGDNPSSGQNPDGFYVLTATDAVDPDPTLSLSDTGSAAVFGPFADGTTIKLTQAAGATPGQKDGPGVVDHRITVNGDGSLTATDASGNVSDPVFCKVPQPPK